MQIRREQLGALKEANGRRMLDRLVALVTEFEEPARSDPKVRQSCQELMHGAAGFGLATEFEVAAFVACGFEFGPEFATRADLPFQQILTEPETAPRIKAAQMMVLLERSETAAERDPR